MTIADQRAKIREKGYKITVVFGNFYVAQHQKTKVHYTADSIPKLYKKIFKK